jgi:hypothetical protein
MPLSIDVLQDEKSSRWLELFRKLMPGERFERLAPHILEIVGMVAETAIAGGAGMGALRSVLGLFGTSRQNGSKAWREETSLILSTQQKLSERIELLQEDNARLRNELAIQTRQFESAKAEVNALKIEVHDLSKRYGYVTAAIVVLSLATFAGFLLRFAR